MARSTRHLHIALTATTESIYQLMDEARREKARNTRARSSTTATASRMAMNSYVRMARTKSHHALHLRRQIEGELS